MHMFLPNQEGGTPITLLFLRWLHAHGFVTINKQKLDELVRGM